VTDSIEIDPEALEQASRDLADAGRRITGGAAAAGSVGISGRAFGTMNSYLGAGITLAADATVDLLRVAGDVASALGVAAQRAADDWTAYEQGVSEALLAGDVDLDAAQELL
jgi:hypothetical protein